MDEYWFCGIFPKDGVSEDSLTEEQKKIIEEEAKKENLDNYKDGWLGYGTENGWKFMKHGQLVVFIEEEKSNIARNKLYELIRKKHEEN